PQGRPRISSPRSNQRPGDDPRPVSARAVRRHAPANHDRDGPQREADLADRGRADERARHHDPGPGPHADERADGRGEHVDPVHQSRSRRDRGDGRRRRRDVRRGHRRIRSRRRGVRTTGPPVYEGTSRIRSGPVQGRRPPPLPAWLRPESRAAAERLSVPPSLRLREAALRTCPGTDPPTGEGRASRRQIQVVFQDPVGSLDPRMRVWQIVGEPIRAQIPAITKAELKDRVAALLPMVGLPEGSLELYPHEFSGGGRQRLSLARALGLHPKLIILDEPTSALDVAVQAQILNRLVSLEQEQGFAYLLIAHNVAAVRYVADRVAVMYLGKLAEVGP